MRPGCSLAQVPNASADTGGASEGSTTTPAPRRMVRVAEAAPGVSWRSANQRRWQPPDISVPCQVHGVGRRPGGV